MTGFVKNGSFGPAVDNRPGCFLKSLISNDLRRVVAAGGRRAESTAFRQENPFPRETFAVQARDCWEQENCAGTLPRKQRPRVVRIGAARALALRKVEGSRREVRGNETASKAARVARRREFLSANALTTWKPRQSEKDSRPRSCSLGPAQRCAVK
jgi:hypothetical protein